MSCTYCHQICFAEVATAPWYEWKYPVSHALEEKTKKNNKLIHDFIEYVLAREIIIQLVSKDCKMSTVEARESCNNTVAYMK